MRSITVIFVATFMAAAALPSKAAPTEQASKSFLSANAKKKGVVVVPGIQYRVLKAGKGAQPGRRDCATVNYKGSFIDGKIFDQSKPGQPITFGVGQVIAGWTEALQMMHEGDKWELVIPPGLAYGRSGTPDGTIPPNETLVFEVELLKVAPSQMGQCPQ
ncbi:MAG: FKBP-type peptidyl-prolyl cis-trans isomerase [Alphaproteobacteria bacterium]|nr:FKBP-type peptidyl-prolyl cis-trans isomerase [Alphaproteobacteria bacterium]MBV9693438.1 FKBP-type peptidyl-prolyl cis-trans isomerase [Alphaproteobacteria bacterium]